MLIKLNGKVEEQIYQQNHWFVKVRKIKLKLKRTKTSTFLPYIFCSKFQLCWDSKNLGKSLTGILTPHPHLGASDLHERHMLLSDEINNRNKVTIDDK